MAARTKRAQGAKPADDRGRQAPTAAPPARVPVDPRRLQFHFAFWRDAEPTCCWVEDGVLHYDGEIVLLDEDFQHEANVGDFEFYEFRAPFDPNGDNEELFHIMDEDSEHSIVLGRILEHAPSMEAFALGLSKVVYLARLVVDPPFRRQGVARLFLWRVLELYADQGAVGVFLMPAPLQDSGAFYYMDSDGRSKDLSPEERAEYDRRQQDLIRLYERAGFKRLGSSDIWGLNLDQGLPPKPDLAGADTAAIED